MCVRKNARENTFQCLKKVIKKIKIKKLNYLYQTPFLFIENFFKKASSILNYCLIRIKMKLAEVWLFWCLLHMYFFPELWKHLLKTVKSNSKNWINCPFPCPLAYLRTKEQFGVLCPTQLRSYGAELLPKTGVFLLAVVLYSIFASCGILKNKYIQHGCH